MFGPLKLTAHITWDPETNNRPTVSGKRMEEVEEE